MVLMFHVFLFLPNLFLSYYFTHDITLSVLICISVFAMGLQSSLMVKAQANFLSSKTIYSETIRTGGYFLLSWLTLHFTPLDETHALFLSSIFAFSASSAYLMLAISKKMKLLPSPSSETTTNPDSFREMAIRFFRYGFPLSLWFIVVYFFSYIDKIILLKKMGAEVQGNYQAMFDLLSKGFTLFISPVLISLMPLLSVAYKEGRVEEITKLLKKIIAVEFLAFLLVVVLYFSFGADLLLFILKVPDLKVYVHSGLIIIAGTFLWQMAMVLNKQYELKLQSNRLLLFAGITLLVQLVYFYYFYQSLTTLFIAGGYLLSSFVYLVLVALPWIRRSLQFTKKLN